MTDDLKEVHEKLDKMNDTMIDIRISQAKTEISVAEHIRRTALAEEGIQLLHDEIKPLKKHVQIIDYIWKFILTLGSLLLFLNQMNWLKRITDFLHL